MKEADEKLLRIFHNNLVGMILTDKDHLITDINDYLLRLAEVEKEDVIGKNGVELGIMSEELARAMWQELEEKGYISSVELSYKTKSNRIITGLVSTERINIDGELHWLTTVIDISKKKNAEEKITESELRFRTLTSIAPVGIFETDATGLTTYVNEAWLEYTGMNFEEAMGEGWLNAVYPEDREMLAKGWYSKTETAAASYSEYRLMDKQGKLRWVHGKAIPVINKDGKITGYIGTISDVTERKLAMESLKQSEERFRTLTRTAPVGIFETDEKGLTTYVNETWLEYTGLPFEESRGDAWMGLIHPEDRDMEVNTWYSKTERAEISHSEYRIIDKNGKLRWVNGKAVPLIDKDGKITGYIGTITDVTERKLAMEFLKQNEETLNKAQAISRTGSWEFNPFTSELTWSKEQYRIFELEGHPSKTLYEAYKKKYHPDDLPKLENAMRRAVEKAQGFTYEHRIICKDGSIKYILGIGEVVLDTDGKVASIKGTGQDITEYKKIEHEILQSHQRMDTLINTIDGIVWEADAASFEFIFVSKKAEQILGYTVEQWLGEKEFWANHMHPDDRAWAVEYCISHTKKKRKYDFEYRMIRRDGSVVWLRDIVTVIAENGKPAQLRGIMVDITERKKAEEEISYSASLLENVSDAILSLDTQRRIMSWNIASEHMYGFTKEEVLGKRIPEVVVFEFPGTNNEAVFKEVVEKGNWKGEIYFIHPKNGQTIIALGNINLLKNTEGEITGFIATSKDITARKQVEDALNERTEQLRELSTHLQEVREEERTNIAREIHDELGQQLTGLKMDITWLKKRVKADDAAIKNKFSDSIKLIDASVNTIRRIVTELRPSIIDDLGLNAAIEWHVVDFGKKIGVTIKYENDFDDKNIKPAISIGLFRILQESLTNIAKHAQAKNVTIEIEQVRDAIHLSVQDDGIGFDTGIRQIDKTFGLLGMKERAHKMNGDCLISSTPGKGTKIEVHIPLH